MELTLQTSPKTQLLARAILKMLSWRLDVITHGPPKYVLIGAPHTSGLDLFFAILLMHATGIKLHWVAKDTLFRWPISGIMRWLGGIPVNRRSKNNFVQQIVDIFNRHDELIIAIAPEGTRSKADYWRTGFYYIALGAGVPIAMGFIDYREKVVGIGPMFFPGGDIHADFVQVQAFYDGKTGRRPGKKGDIKLRPD